MLCHGCSSPVFGVPPPRSAFRPRRQQPLRPARLRLRVVDVRSGLLQSVGLVQDPRAARFQGVSMEFRRRQPAVIRHAASSTTATAAGRDEAALLQLPAVDGRLRHGDGRSCRRQRWIHGRNPAGTAAHRLQPVDRRSSRFNAAGSRRRVPVRQRGRRTAVWHGRRQRQRVQQHRVSSSTGEAARRNGVGPRRRRQRQRRLLGLTSGHPRGTDGGDRRTTASVILSVHAGRDAVWRRRGVVAIAIRHSLPTHLL